MLMQETGVRSVRQGKFIEVDSAVGTLSHTSSQARASMCPPAGLGGYVIHLRSCSRCAAMQLWGKVCLDRVRGPVIHRHIPC